MFVLTQTVKKSGPKSCFSRKKKKKKKPHNLNDFAKTDMFYDQVQILGLGASYHFPILDRPIHILNPNPNYKLCHFERNVVPIQTKDFDPLT